MAAIKTRSEPKANGPARALGIVSLGVLLASSTWFTGTAAARELIAVWSLSPGEAALLTNATQLGFILGTLIFALANLADRFDARRVFALSALAGAACNLGFAWLADGLAVALAFRLLTGIALAGVYPVGMKIVASWYSSGLGWRLGLLVGCLTLGTAFPYGVVAFGVGLDWRTLASVGSIAATMAAVLVGFAIAEGPLLRTRARLDLGMALAVFRHPPFRATALGYFGHMWELYALWSLSSFWLAECLGDDPTASARIPLWACATVAIGALGCVLGGLASRWIGERNVAMIALLGSGAACLASGFAAMLPAPLLLAFLLIWGVLVVADSPQFSALAARHAPPEYTGTALTVQNGIGFAVTTLAIQTLPWLAGPLGWRWTFTLLAIGPLLGALSLRRLPPR
jgi:MFS family permease